MPTYTKLSISENRYVLVGHLVNYVKKTRGVDPVEFSHWREDVEIFFSEVDEHITMYTEKLQSGAELSGDEFYRYHLSIGTYNQLIFLFATIFNEIQNGPISIPYSLLSHELEGTDAVITFNWDTLLDRALWASGKWSPGNGYLLRPEAIFDDGWKTSDVFPAFINSPLYLKLHGSTNWLAPYHHPGVHYSSKEKYNLSRYAIDKLYVFLHARKAYNTYEGRYWGPYQPYSYCYYPPNLPVERDDVRPGFTSVRIVVAPDLPEHGKYVMGDREVFSMPLIVPPVRNKQYKRYGKIFSTIWSTAEEVISGCKMLYIIGYSFPTTDLATRDMFKVALQRNVELEKIIIINPSPEKVFELLTQDFGLNHNLVEVRPHRFEVGCARTGKFL